MKLDAILSDLEKAGFSAMEARVYLDLAGTGELNGSQIAKRIGQSRSSVYAALDALQARGAVYAVPGETQNYRAEEPEALFSKLEKRLRDSAHRVVAALSTLRREGPSQAFVNVQGTQLVLEKAGQLIDAAQREIYINTCIDPALLGEGLRAAAERGVRIIVFSFGSFSISGLPIELFAVGQAAAPGDEKRLMLVCDMKAALIAAAAPDGELCGTFSTNPLLARVTAEHIHHDIYLHKLKKKSKKELFGPDILLHSLLEGPETVL